MSRSRWAYCPLKNAFLALFFGFLIYLTGCGSARCPIQAHQKPEQLIGGYRSMRTPIRTLRAEARVDQRAKKGRIRGTVWMLVDLPARLRFDAMTQIGPAATLTSDGDAFALTDLREHRYLVGPTCPENIARLLGIRMSAEDVIRLMIGDSPLIDAQRKSVSCVEGGRYRVTLIAANGTTQEADFEVRSSDVEAPPEQQYLRLVRSEVFDARGQSEWRATFGDYEVVRDPQSPEHLGVALPSWIRFEDRHHNVDTLVRFKSRKINAPIPEEAFQQTPRPGLTHEVVQCS